MPSEIIKSDVDNLKAEGVDDGQILEANQIISYFNYVNRSLNGLGVSTDGDTIGYYTDD
jgi:alkylhydroperoxidase family enzyme